MKREMEEFERRFAAMLSGQTLPMDAIVRYVAGAKGKRLRPRLVFGSARQFGTVNETTWRTALFVEMLHTATLIHDDVVDESNERRGQASVNARWGNKAAVLAGDYLLSKAMQLLSDPKDHRILKEMLDVTMAMSEGELLQASNTRHLTAEAYLDIIERKTARLFLACCTGGALSVGANDDQVAAAADFGFNYGLVFQMRDDILDDDSPETTALAKQLLPVYIEKVRKAFRCLS